MTVSSNVNTTAQTLNRYIAQLAEGEPDWHLYRLLLQYGVLRQSSKLPKDVARGVDGYCFANCQSALAKLERKEPGQYRYAEGFAASADALNVPIHHAWLVDMQGRIVDCTWGHSPNTAYIGFTFATPLVLSRDVSELGIPLFQNRSVRDAYFSHPRRRRPPSSVLIKELAGLTKTVRPECSKCLAP